MSLAHIPTFPIPSTYTCHCGAKATGYARHFHGYVKNGELHREPLPGICPVCDDHESQTTMLLCPVCREPHPPSIPRNSGKDLCYHCGRSFRNCRCYPGPVTKLYRALKARLWRVTDRSDRKP